jgi:hypothetical protein
MDRSRNTESLGARADRPIRSAGKSDSTPEKVSSSQGGLDTRREA